jgi:carbon storage regulator
MLVLTRKQSERIVIGDEITVTIVEILVDKVRLGFEAPAEIGIWRHELWIKREDLKSQT